MNAYETRMVCGRCKSRAVQTLMRWNQLFVCPTCLDALDTPLSPVTRSLELDRTLSGRLLPIAASATCRLPRWHAACSTSSATNR